MACKSTWTGFQNRRGGLSFFGLVKDAFRTKDFESMTPGPISFPFLYLSLPFILCSVTFNVLLYHSSIKY